MELALDRELSEESWSLGQIWGQSSGVVQECTTLYLNLPAHFVKGALGMGVLSKDSPVEVLIQDRAMR